MSEKLIINNYLCLLTLVLISTIGCSSPRESNSELSNSELREFWEAAVVTPATVIKHGVDLKGYFDSDAAPVSLSGPELFSRSVNIAGTEPGPIAYLNWYRITKGESESHGEVTLSDALSGDTKYQVKVSSPAYLLCPAQRLTDGPPDEIPAGLNYYKAYRILDAPNLDLGVKLSADFDSDNQQRMVGAASFLCLPAEEWHHEEYFAIKDAGSCFVVYGLEPVSMDIDATSIDQFGLHKLQLSSSEWLCVEATIN